MPRSRQLAAIMFTDIVGYTALMQLGFQKNPTIPLRIGIHTGDIIFSEEEIIGDSVIVVNYIENDRIKVILEEYL